LLPDLIDGLKWLSSLCFSAPHLASRCVIFIQVMPILQLIKHIPYFLYVFLEFISLDTLSV